MEGRACRVWATEDALQPVRAPVAHGRHADTFDGLMLGETIMPGDQTRIPISKICTRDNLVAIDGLDIRNPADRVKYYNRLIERMPGQNNGSLGGGDSGGGGASGEW